MNSNIKNRIQNLCKLLNIKVPILQGAMAHISNYILAGAVSKSGGLGVLASSGMSPEKLRHEIHQLKKITNNTYGVNIALKSDNLNELINVIKQENVPIIITGAGNPEPYIEKLKNNNTVVIPVVASVALAKRVARFGADAVIAEGSESGGHIGNTNTMCLIPQIVDAVNIPVIAAGGIADGRGIAAAYMLGADAVQLGTRFLVTKESPVHAYYKQLILRAKDISTVVLNTTKIDRDNIRALKSPLANQYLKAELEQNSTTSGMLENALKIAATQGDSAKGIFMAGQCSGLINEELTVEILLKNIWTEACNNMMMGDILNEGENDT